MLSLWAGASTSSNPQLATPISSLAISDSMNLMVEILSIVSWSMSLFHLNFLSTSSHLLTSETNCLWKLAAPGLRSRNWTQPGEESYSAQRSFPPSSPTELAQLTNTIIGSFRRNKEPKLAHRLGLEQSPRHCVLCWFSGGSQQKNLDKKNRYRNIKQSLSHTYLYYMWMGARDQY